MRTVRSVCRVPMRLSEGMTHGSLFANCVHCSSPTSGIVRGVYVGVGLGFGGRARGVVVCGWSLLSVAGWSCGRGVGSVELYFDIYGEHFLANMVVFVLLCPVSIFTIRKRVTIRKGTVDVGRTVRIVRGGDGCAFFCGTTSLDGTGVHSVRYRNSVRRILGILFGSDNVDCIVGSGRIVLGDAPMIITAPRRDGGVIIGNGVESALNRSIVKTAVVRGGGTRGNSVDSVGKSFSLSMDPNTIVIVSCVNCMARRLGTVTKTPLGMMLGSSSHALSRIIMINFNSRGGTGLAKTISSVGVSRVVNSHPVVATSSTLRNAIPKLLISGDKGTPNDKGSFRLHNTCSINVGGDSKSCNTGITPLVLVSGMRKDLSVLGPRSVRAMAMLGSTTSTTVCNTHTTNNIILIAAGHPGRTATFHLGCGGGFNFTATAGLPGRTSLVSCLRTCRSKKCSSTC